MDAERLQDHLAIADELIRRGSERVQKQRWLVTQLESNGCDAAEARALLSSFQEMQAIYIEDRKAISERLDGRT